jgi:hypothetical protein
MGTKTYKFSGTLEITWTRTLTVDDDDREDLRALNIDLDDPDFDPYLCPNLGEWGALQDNLMLDDDYWDDVEIEVTEVEPVMAESSQ